MTKKFIKNFNQEISVGPAENDFSLVEFGCSGELNSFDVLKKIVLEGVEEVVFEKEVSEISPNLRTLCLSRIKNIRFKFDYYNPSHASVSVLSFLVLKDLGDETMKFVVDQLIDSNRIHHLEVVDTNLFTIFSDKSTNCLEDKFIYLQELVVNISLDSITKPIIQNLRWLQTLCFRNNSKSTIVIRNLPNLINLVLTQANTKMNIFEEQLLEIRCGHGVDSEIDLVGVNDISEYFKEYDFGTEEIERQRFIDGRSEDGIAKDDQKNYFPWVFVFEIENVPRLKIIHHDNLQNVRLKLVDGEYEFGGLKSHIPSSPWDGY